jgi:quinol monooxygenase YgiN
LKKQMVVHKVAGVPGRVNPFAVPSSTSWEKTIMVTERAELPVTPGREREFERQFASGEAHLRGAKGCLGVSLARGVESPSTYLLLIEWESLAAHEAFSATEGFAAFVGLIRPCLAGKPNTQHFDPLKRL